MNQETATLLQEFVNFGNNGRVADPDMIERAGPCIEAMSGIDSRPDTYAHIQKVQEIMNLAIQNLMKRAQVHDQSKLEHPEKTFFDKYTTQLRGSTYMSEEYKTFINGGLKKALDHHYANNSHHPEHYPECNSEEIDQLQCDIDQMKNGLFDSHVSDPEFIKRSIARAERELAVAKSRINGMSLLDIVEMLVDWKAASLRHNDGSLAKSIELNQKRFGYCDQLKAIFINTAEELGIYQ